jgi:hypothetical protein
MGQEGAEAILSTFLRSTSIPDEIFHIITRARDSTRAFRTALYAFRCLEASLVPSQKKQTSFLYPL